MEYERPTSEGDPGDGWENGGGSGGDIPDEGDLDGSSVRETILPTLFPQFIWLEDFATRFHFVPRYNGQTFVWNISFFKLQGGEN